MQFEKTQTYLNLARGFAGETQAGMRYQLISQKAIAQGYDALANVVKVIAKNETFHAKRFIEELQKRSKKLDNIDVCAGFPYHGKDLAESLKFAAEDERTEHSEIYPSFAKIAKEEGFDNLARLFTMVANVEKRHEDIFNYLYSAFTNGTLYKCDENVFYVCSSCGYVASLKEAWNVCPLCLSSQGFVELRLPPLK